MTYHLLQEEHVRIIDKNNAPLSFARVFTSEDTLSVEDWHERLL